MALRRTVLPLALALLATDASADAPASCAHWPAWESFRATFISADGRVVEHASARRQTVSEAQAYALLLALAADDRATFDTLLTWTTNNLAQGDLSRHLPAWQWGERDDGSYGPLDANPATDADLWIAYVLAEAGRRWGIPAYLARSHAVGDLVLRQSVAELPGLGPVLLPAPQGFGAAPGPWRLNPGYLPIQVLRGLAAAHPDQRERWLALLASSVAVLHGAAASRRIGYASTTGERSRSTTARPPPAVTARYACISGWGCCAADPERAAPAPLPAHSASFAAPASPERIDVLGGRVLDANAWAFSAAVAPWLEQTERAPPAPVATRHATRPAREGITGAPCCSSRKAGARSPALGPDGSAAPGGSMRRASRLAAILQLALPVAGA
jgi:endoglucanase